MRSSLFIAAVLAVLPETFRKHGEPKSAVSAALGVAEELELALGESVDVAHVEGPVRGGSPIAPLSVAPPAASPALETAPPNPGEGDAK